MASQYPQRVSQDRFGNAFVLKSAKAIVNRKTGEIIEGVFKTYVELGGKLYQIDVSRANKQAKDGRNMVWVKVTHKKKTQGSTNGSTI